MPESLADLVECFGRSPLKRLSVTGDHASATVGAWSTVFRTFEHLEELIVGGSAHTRVTDVFYGLFAASMLPEDLPFACPNLKRIEVAGLGEVETYAVMLECFQYRSDQGVVLQVLDLTSMPNAEGFTSELRDTVIEAMSKVVECIQTSSSASETDDEQENEGQV